MEAQNTEARIKRTYNVDRVGKMPSDPSQRLSCLFERFGAEKCAEFVRSVDPLESPTQIGVRRMYAYALVYGSYHETAHKLGGSFARHACYFFGLGELSECYTEARREFLAHPSLPKNKQGANDWSGEAKRMLMRLQAALRAAKKLGYQVSGTLTIEAKSLPKKIIEADGKIL